MDQLSAVALKNLGDKIPDKRKQAATEVENVVRGMKQRGDVLAIKALVESLHQRYINNSMQPNMRKGGCLAMASVAVVMLKDNKDILESLMRPVLGCMGDQDAKVRFHACEAMYNICRTSRADVLFAFGAIFDQLCRLSADPDLQVKSGGELLDRLVKDIVTEFVGFDIILFVSLIRERIYSTNHHVRMFLVSWISLVHSCPGITLIPHLPEFLDGLFMMLSDTNEKICVAVDHVLGELITEMKQEEADYETLVLIVLPHCQVHHDFTVLTGLRWIREFLQRAGHSLLSKTPEILGAVLPCISHREENIRQIAVRINTQIKTILEETQKEFDLASVLHVAALELVKHYVPTRLASLSWILMLFRKNAEATLLHVDELFPLLLKTLSDPSDPVVSLDLEVLAGFSSSSDALFSRFIHSLLELFSTDKDLLNKAGFIVRTLSLMLESKKIYCELSKNLEQEKDLEFASAMVQTLNMILLTAQELAELRKLIRDSPNCEDGCKLFTSLYSSWCHNPVASLSLCLLSQAYEHASNLVRGMGEFEVTVGLLVQVDKLVQLLESPVFSFLRLQLLEPNSCPHLLKTLYGILMLLPQTSAFDTLRSRLKAVSTLSLLQNFMHQQPSLSQHHSHQGLDFEEMYQQFTAMQQRHQASQNRRELSSGSANGVSATTSS